MQMCISTSAAVKFSLNPVTQGTVELVLVKAKFIQMNFTKKKNKHFDQSILLIDLPFDPAGLTF